MARRYQENVDGVDLWPVWAVIALLGVGLLGGSTIISMSFGGGADVWDVSSYVAVGAACLAVGVAGYVLTS